MKPINYTHLTMITKTAIHLAERYEPHKPSADLLEKIEELIFRSFFILCPIRKTPQQSFENEDNYERCKILRREIVAGFPITKIVLTIAHLDHDPENWDVKDERLAALCQRCHLNYDRSRHINKRKYGINYKLNQLNLEL